VPNLGVKFLGFPIPPPFPVVPLVKAAFSSPILPFLSPLRPPIFYFNPAPPIPWFFSPPTPTFGIDSIPPFFPPLPLSVTFFYYTSINLVFLPGCFDFCYEVSGTNVYFCFTFRPTDLLDHTIVGHLSSFFPRFFPFLNSLFLLWPFCDNSRLKVVYPLNPLSFGALDFLPRIHSFFYSVSSLFPLVFLYQQLSFGFCDSPPILVPSSGTFPKNSKKAHDKGLPPTPTLLGTDRHLRLAPPRFSLFFFEPPFL